MKKLLLILGLIVPMLVTTATAATFGNRANKSSIGNFITDCRNYEGAEVIHLGSFATSIGKGVLNIISIGDSEAKEVLNLIKDVKSLYILNYKECSTSNKEKVNNHLVKMLKDSEMLLEVKDGDDKVKIYGVVDEKKGEINDFILHTPSECAVICILGSISTEALAKLALDD